MATTRAESKFCWYFPLFFFALTLTSAWAKDINIPASDYRPDRGSRFYLLSEQTFSSQDVSKVRLEAESSYSDEGRGVDIRLYKIPSPIKFLESQKNLHRPKVEGRYQGEGIRNALTYVWDVLYKKSRLVWQRLLSFSSRQKATKENPQFSQRPPYEYQTPFKNNPQFGFLPGLTLVQSFRYPVNKAKPISNKDVKLAGSSSNYIKPEGSRGTIHVPFGKLAPGLYLVEGLLGSYRANCFLFVSDSVAVTKVSSDELLVWTVNRETGKVMPNAAIQITDGVGRLGSGKTNEKGVYVLKKKDMERTYVFGEDAQGGVFISENFYYDSEIYAKKIYVTTDRPLYRPGELVYFKGLGREFKNSTQSVALSQATGLLKVFDPTGQTIWKKKVSIKEGTFSGSFTLPSEAISGGYELNLNMDEAIYTSYIRVANFVKPHFEVEIDVNEKELDLGQEQTAQIVLKYPNGKPVMNASVEVEIRRQILTMNDGEMREEGAFAGQFSSEEYTSDENGEVEIKIPAERKANKTIINVRAVDDHSYRVNKTKEFIVTSELGFCSLTSQEEMSLPGIEVPFHLEISRSNKKQELSELTWELTRLEDQTKTTGAISGADFNLLFPRGGNYVITVLNKEKLILATKSHFVDGEGLRTAEGTITIALDKESYLPGEEAKFVLDFSEDVVEAFVTLEREKVERWSLASTPESWIQLERSSAKSFKGSLKVLEAYAPNMTLSVAYVKKGKFVFENKGIKVEIPKIELSFKFDKPRYAPGEKVSVEVQSNFKGRGIAAEMSIGVVDEMIYSLQEELAPTIFDFFYHLRRNQVKTSASLAFHSFDAAVSAINLDEPSSDSSYEQRNLKLMKDRARREDKDTAYWNPALKTDANGKATFSFKMPDSITNWRVTARAFTGNFNVGQKSDRLISHKDFYHTYVGPKRFRKGDKPNLTYVVFNHTGKEQNIYLSVDAVGKKSVKVAARPVYVSFDPEMKDDMELLSQIQTDSAPIDTLATKIAVDKRAWSSLFVLSEGDKFPPDAETIRAYPFSNQSEKVMNSLDALWDYPFGCVEQTASRLLPLSLAYMALDKSSAPEALMTQLNRRISSARSRLISMAGERASFTWWGDMTEENFLLKVYAFYTDFQATKALDIDLPAKHWESLLEDYRAKAPTESFTNKALILWMLKDMGFSVKTLIEGVYASAPPKPSESYMLQHSSLYFDHEMDQSSWAQSILLLDSLSKSPGKSMIKAEDVKQAEELSKDTAYIVTRAVLAMRDKDYQKKNLENILEDASLENILEDASNEEQPTFDRAITLAMLWDSLKISDDVKVADLPAPWKKELNSLGYPAWSYGAKDLPEALDFKNYKYTYRSVKDQTSNIPVRISRNIYKLELVVAKKSDENSDSESESDSEESSEDENDPENFPKYKLGEPVKNGELKSSELYVDKIVIDSDKLFTFSALEVPLLSGMDLENQTWGIVVKDGEDEVELGSAKFGARENTYEIPVEAVQKKVTFYNLIRPSVLGQFVMPPVRFHRMYAPAQMSFEGESKLDFKKYTVR